MTKLPLKWMPAAAHGGPFAGGAPVGLAVHSTESENTPAMAEALAGPNWFGGSKAGTSAHKVVDVDSICEGVKRTVIAYHAGPGGNVVAIAYEFCGRASWSAAKWREPAQLQMLRNAAPHMADDLRAIGAPARWLSLAQLAAVAKSKHPADGGLFTHNDIRLALGGTTHSDPGPNFPYAELLAYVQPELAGGAMPTPIAPTQEDDDMAKYPLYIVAQNRGWALVWPGFVKKIANDEEQHRAQALFGDITGMSDRDFDVTVALHMNANFAGQATSEITTSVAKVVSAADVDEAALGQTVVAGLLPQLITALSAKTGATREDVEQVVRGVFADAAS